MDYYKLLSEVTGLEADYLKLADEVKLIRPSEAIEAIEIAVKNLNIAAVIRCPCCGSENEYSQGFKQNIKPVDEGDWRQVCFDICDRCGHAINVWFWD